MELESTLQFVITVSDQFKYLLSYLEFRVAIVICYDLPPPHTR